MLYKDQLVLTGKINDVGSAIMTNVKDSYRRGIEIISGIKITDYLTWEANATLSQNRIENYVEYIDNWDTGLQDIKQLGKTDISFSPEFMGNSSIRLHFREQLSVSLISSYVGKQFIDNSSNQERMLDDYFLNNLKFEYQLEGNLFKNVVFQLQLNNIFNVEYESNAWVYRYILFGEEYKQDGYFPQAGIHLLGGINLNF
jgi:iron complex outermembrane receptor protein